MVAADLGARGVDVSSISVPQSYLAAAGALVLAFVAHASFAFFNQTAPVDQAGGNTALAAIGNSFANLAEGVETPQQVSELTEAQAHRAEPQRAIEPIEPQQVAPPVVQAHAALHPTNQINAVQGGVPLVAVEAQQVLEPVEQIAQQVPSVAPSPMPVPVDVTPAAEAVRPIETASPVRASLEPAVSPEVQEAIPQSSPILASLRPTERPIRPEPKPVTPTPPKTTAKPRPDPAAKPQGNGAANATRGIASSTRSQSGGQAQTAAGQAQVQGNAAASNYAGLVMRRIQRAKRRADVRGVALVRFSVSANGRLSSVSLARSSGSGRLDEIAMVQVRRAAPFPPPPAGARRTFTVRIKGK